MKLFRYKTGGSYQIKISEEIFHKSRERMTADLTHFSEGDISEIQRARQEWETLAAEKDLSQYNDGEFNATEIFSIFMDALTQQMASDGVPEIISYRQRCEIPADIRKQIDKAFDGFQTMERRIFARKAGDETVVFSLLGGLGRALQILYTGKNEEMRAFEEQVVRYVAGESSSSRKLLMKLIKKHGVKHEGIRQTVFAIRDEMLLAELAYKSLNQ